MVEIPANHLLERSFHPMLYLITKRHLVWEESRLVVEGAPGRDLGPDKEAHLVGQVQVPGVRRFDMAAEAVEPQVLCLLELVAQKILGRDSVNSVGVQVLVEGTQQEER